MLLTLALILLKNGIRKMGDSEYFGCALEDLYFFTIRLNGLTR